MGAASVARPTLGDSITEGFATAVGALVAGIGDGVVVAGAGVVVRLGFVVVRFGVATVGVVSAGSNFGAAVILGVVDVSGTIGLSRGVEPCGFVAFDSSSRIDSARNVL
jgi:hypothetical protein